jgi:hypothetical protein
MNLVRLEHFESFEAAARPVKLQACEAFEVCEGSVACKVG